MEHLCILVTGARDWQDEQLVKNALDQFKNKKVILIHGNCAGLDKIAEKVGIELGFEIESHPADWKKYGKAAGPIRNKEMIQSLNNYKNKYMFAFHDAIDLSRGTKDCVKQAEKMNIFAQIIKHD